MVIKMILTNAFDPDPRVYKEAKALVEEGHEVEIICWDRDKRYFNKDLEVIDKIKVKRFFPEGSYGKGPQQIIGYIKFISMVRQYLKNKEFHIIHAHDIDGALVGVLTKKNKKLIWDMHEFFDGFNYSNFRKFVYNIIAKICFRNSNGIIFVSDSQHKRYSEYIDLNKTVTETIMNCPESKIFNDFKRIKSNKLRISFIGSVREVDTLKLLMDVGENFKNVKVYIHGTGVAYNELKALEDNYENTVITGKFEYQNIKELYESSDVIYSVYDSRQLNVREAFPVKGFESIVTGTPIIASENTFFGDFLVNNNIGFVIDETDFIDLENLMKKILSNTEILKEKSQNTKKFVHNFSWETQSEKLIEFYKLLTD